MADWSKYPKARIFETHGVEISGERGNQLYGSCPFTDKEDKFYINRDNWLWDSKSGGMSGNITQFLEMIQDNYEADCTDEELAPLSRNRGLPPEALKYWHIGWMGDRYSIPIRDIKGAMVDIRMYHLGRRQMRSTAGCSVGLMGAERLGKDLNAPAYICEGEWDAIALQWLLKKLRQPGIVVAVPGAGTFKREWIQWFTGRRVTVLYDNDDPGRKGAAMVYERMHTAVRAMEFIHWPDNLPDGFDVRDWIRYGIKKDTLDLCLERLRKLLKKMPVETNGKVGMTASGKRIRLIAPAKEGKRPERPDVIPTLDDVHTVYKKWLHLENTDAIDMMLAVTLSQRMDGPPVWLFLVSPPGGAKTVTLSGLTQYESVYSTSSLTSHSLISGANFQGQSDPSLIPRLRDKVLVIKDFTSILGMRDSDKEEIFAILRDAYDGKCGKVFGNGVERAYESRFTIVAAVTPSIYFLGQRHAALGERFLKFRMGDNLHHHDEEEIIAKAIENVDRDTKLKEELASVTGLFLTYGFETFRPAALADMHHKRIIAMAQLGARLRGTVSREQYNSDMMTGKPFAEVGSRLGIQLSKIARALAMVRGHDAVGDEEIRIVRKVVIDTVAQHSEDVVRCMYERQKKVRDGKMTSNDIAIETRYSMTTVRRILDDLNLLKVVRRTGVQGSGYRQVWSLTPYILRCIEVSGVYSEPAVPRLVLKRKRD